MINLLEKNKVISLVFVILTVLEIFFFSEIETPVGTRISFATIYHFVIFFLLGFFLLAAIKGNKKIKVKHLILVFICSLIYAVFDEIHQSFVPGRDASIRDILTDTAGIIFSLLIYFPINLSSIFDIRNFIPYNTFNYFLGNI